MSDKNDRQPAGPRDYRATLFLPATDFPMKAGLPAAEPKWLERWEAMNLYGKLREQSAGRPRFILHDGPPYANGEIHLGTGLNKVLKDFVVRSQQMLGRDAPYVPGWDCHGLPIEWKIEEQYRARGKSKDDVPIVELRAECRAFAEKWIGVQRQQFKRLGCIGDWERPYSSMDFRAEATIAAELHKFVANGLLYRGSRPVMWSPVEKTALAEAEVEYHEKTSPTIYVRFPVIGIQPKSYHRVATDFEYSIETEQSDSLGTNSYDKLQTELEREILSARELIQNHTSVIIWTTTPWTIPGNRAIAFSETIPYGLYEVTAAEEGSHARAGEKLLLADPLAEQTAAHAKCALRRISSVKPEGLVCAHPFRGRGYEFDVPLLPGAHVTTEAGTGFVHTAPGHGEEDFELGLKSGLEVPYTVDEEGAFVDSVPLFAGKRILTPEGKDGEANGAVIRELIACGALLAKGTLRHQYPHSWRSKAPVIFRATPQWFVAVDKTLPEYGATLRELALKAIRETKWFPRQSQNRLAAMVRERPDWVLSRQRAWGVPIAVFVHGKTGKLLDDPEVNARIVAAFREEGADAWYTSPPERFLGPAHAPEDYEQVTDILDVWFESGTTHAFVVENPLNPAWPKAERADLYLEGSDQHRGWFQSSLLESCGTRGRAPYRAVLTHGFFLDEEGRKMSKSLGNTVLPQVIAEKHGAEILRLWAASSDFTEDLRIGQDILQANVDGYRRLRNTIRFMLANLAGFEESERLAEQEMPELERYMLARLAELDALVRAGYENFDFNRVYATLFNFCTGDLSAFYFDIRKDALYCDARTASRRRAARTVLDELFHRIVTWLAPILCFTMEEAWLTRFPDAGGSVHLRTFPETPASWRDEDLIAKWTRLRGLRRVVTGALEVARRDKTIGASLEAAPVLHLAEAADAKLFEGVDLAELAITSAARIETGEAPADAFRLAEVPGAAVAFHAAEGEKCARCWKILPEVGTLAGHPDLCQRCADVTGA